jgi:probable phosphoglycerate mutase
MTTSKYVIEADGGSRGNPGPSGSGAILIDSDTGRVVTEISKFGGVASNNVAEYRAVIAGLTEVFRQNPNASVSVRMDSKLVVEQMSGNWKIKHPDMQVLAIEVQKLIAGKKVTWSWIPREQNSRADALANLAMDTEQDLIRHIEDSEPQSSSSLEFNPILPSSFRSPGEVREPLTTIILVRHGRTALTEAHKISGGTGDDPNLSKLGHEDADAVAKLIDGFGSQKTFGHLPRPTAVVASPMQRTRETAAAIAGLLGLPVDTEEGLREISFGDWDGHTNEQVAELWPDIFKTWRGSWTESPPNGESLEDFDNRIRAVRKLILEKYRGQTVVVVAHVMPIRGFLTLAMDGGPAGYWRPQVAPCSISVIRHWGQEFAEVVTANFTAHL